MNKALLSTWLNKTTTLDSPAKANTNQRAGHGVGKGQVQDRGFILKQRTKHL